MGKKGDKATTEGDKAVIDLLDKLQGIEGITSKKMFGGHGIFHEKKMFGIIDSKGKAFLKVTDENRADYEKAASVQHSRMPYFSIPEKVLKSKKEVEIWAKKSIAVSK